MRRNEKESRRDKISAAQSVEKVRLELGFF